MLIFTKINLWGFLFHMAIFLLLVVYIPGETMLSNRHTTHEKILRVITFIDTTYKENQQIKQYTMQNNLGQ